MAETEKHDRLQLSSFVKLSLSSDRSCLLANFSEPPSPDSGFQPSVQELQTMIAEFGVTYGVMEAEALQNLLDTWLTPMSGVLLAQGVSAIAPVPEMIEFRFHLPEEKSLLERGDGSVDFRELGLLQNVLKGQVLAVKIPAIQGIPGIDVTGREISVKEPTPLPWPMGKGTVISEDGRTLLAAIDGQVLYGVDRKVTVAPIFIVKGSVDFSTGNIDFRGSVVIQENVLSGFTVKADKNIEVSGIVESATVYAGGDIVIHGGVQGSAKSQIKAKGSIKALYLQNAVVQAGETLIVSDSVMHSQISAKEIRITGKRGMLVGGVAKATEHLVAQIIGSHVGTVTQIFLGSDIPPKRLLQRLAGEMAAQTDNLGKIKSTLQLLSSIEEGGKKLTPEQESAKIRLEYTQLKEEAELAEAELKKRDLEIVIEQAVPPSLQVSTIAYPGVHILSTAGDLFLEEITNPCKWVAYEWGIERVSI